MVRPRVFFDFSVDNESVGRVIFELFNDSAPRTCENFRALCTGEKGLSPSGNPLYYKNSIVHRSIQDFMIQGGDFTKRNGSGGESIYGGPFVDEDLSRPLDSEALLCMANKGPNTNGSQFFITLRECPHLNGKHVVFGKVIKGFEDVVKRILRVPVDEKDRPVKPILISSCGELELRKPATESKKPAGKRPQSDASDSGRKSLSRHRKGGSPTPDSETTRRRKKSKHKKDSDDIRSAENETEGGIVQETEEEYDARLEREEMKRLREGRREDLERIKRQHDGQVRNTGGICFKGRGRMKYVDPELSRKHQLL